MSVPIKPTLHKVLIKVEDHPDKKSADKAGIILAESAAMNKKVAFTVGTIMEIGPTAFVDYFTDDYKGPVCKVGDRVTIAKYSGNNFTHEGSMYRLINDVDIHGVVEDPNFDFID